MTNQFFRACSKVALAAVPLLILAACGGGSAATNSLPAATATRAQATSSQAQATSTVTATGAPTSTATDASSNVDACSLLTTAEVSAAHGDNLDVATPSSDPLYSYCKYTGSGGEVRIFVAKDVDTSSSVFGTMKINAGEPVVGVGDEGFWSTDSFQPGLYFLKGGILGFISGDEPDPDPSVIALGKVLASRM